MGYDFAGWLDESQEVVYKETLKLESDQVLVAIWTFDVIYLDVDHTVIKTETVEESNPFEIPPHERQGLVFTGWMKEGEVISNTSKIQGHSTLIATYQITITFEFGNGMLDEERTYAFSEDYPLQTPTKTFYEFLGWKNETDGKMIENISELNHSTVLTAVWKLSDGYRANLIWEETNEGWWIAGMVEPYGVLIVPSIHEGNPIFGIKNDAFVGRADLETVLFEENATIVVIGERAFKDSGITSIRLPNTVIEIKKEAFMNCTMLSELILSTGLEIMDASAYRNTLWHQRLRNQLVVTNDTLWIYKGTELEIFVPSHIQRINDFAFSGNTSVKTVVFEPGSLVSVVTNGTFAQSRIETIHMPDGLKSIEDEAFMNEIYLKHLIFSENNQLNSIGIRAFEKSGLETANFPESVTSIGINAFSQTPWLTEHPDDFVIIGTILVRCKLHVTNVTIPEKVTVIGPKAVAYNFIKHVVITRQVERIEEQAFAGTHLDSIVFEEGSHLSYIGENAFFNNYVKGSVTLPASVVIIEEGAFFDCRYLTSIKFTSLIPPAIGVLFNGDYLTKINIDVLAAAFSAYASDPGFEPYVPILRSYG